MRMYGDLVNAICYTAFIPAYLWLWLGQDDASDSSNTKTAGRNVTIAFTVTAAFSWASYLRESPLMSMMACIGNTLTIAFMNLYRWPHPDEIVVVPQFLWSLLITTGNLQLSPTHKFFMGAMSAANATIVVLLTPLLEITDTLPLLLGATSVYFLFHYSSRSSSQKSSSNPPTGSLLTARIASLVLAGTFAYHMSYELGGIVSKPGYALEGGYSILKAAFFALVGLASAGSFQREINLKETLERLVRDRTREIRQQGERLRIVERALQASETAMAVTNSNGRAVWSNGALQRLAGKGETDMVGCSLREVLGLAQEVVAEWFHETDTTENEIVLNGKDLEARISPVFSEDSQGEDGVRFLIVLRDVTANKAIERAEKIAEREATAAKAMQETMQTLSHELRTPLQGIMGMTSLLLEDTSLPTAVQESMSVVMTSSRLLLTLINNMLDVRKCESGMMEEFQLGPLNLSQALEEAVDFCQPFAFITGIKSLNLANGFDLSSIWVKANGLRFQQVLINIISNAIKYSPSGSSIWINVRQISLDEARVEASRALVAGPPTELKLSELSGTDNVAVVSISDAGTGIPENQRSRIFGRFSQLDNRAENSIAGQANSGQPSGTGLGLNLCLTFIQRMGGNIWANNNNFGRGSTFSFFIPIIEKSGNELAQSSGISRSRSSTALSTLSIGEKLRVLIVDDTVINLKVLSRILHRLGVTEITTANSGSEALRELSKQDFNLVLTDLQMPQMSGIELTNLIHEMDRQPIVVGLTAEVNEAVDAQCVHAGMKRVLHKPITASKMCKFLETLTL